MIITESQSLKSQFDAIPPPNNVFDTPNHRLYLLTNEEKTNRTYRLISSKANPIKGNTIVGPSGFFILNVAAMRGFHPSCKDMNIENIILFDRSIRVEHFWENFSHTICKSEHDSFFPAFLKLISENKALYFDDRIISPDISYDDCCSRFLKDLQNSTSWCSTPEKFLFIKNIFIKDHFIFKRVDLFDDKAIECAKLVVQAQLTIDILYLSNVSEYAETQEDIQKLRSFVGTITNVNSFVILTKFRTEEEIYQHVMGEKNHPLEQYIVKAPSTASEIAKILPCSSHLIS